MQDARLSSIDKTWDTPLHYQLIRVTSVTKQLSEMFSTTYRSRLCVNRFVYK